MSRRPFSLVPLLAGLILLFLDVFIYVPVVSFILSPISGAGRWAGLFFVTAIGLLFAPSRRQTGISRSFYFDVSTIVTLLLVAFLVTAFTGGIPLLSFLKWVGLLCQVLIFLYIVPRFLTGRDWRHLLLSILLISAIAIATALAVGLTGFQVTNVPILEQGRLAAIGNPNSVALIAVFTALGALWEVQQPYLQHGWYKFMLYGVMLAALVVLFWTGSRSSAVGFIAGLGVWLLGTGRFKIALGVGSVALISLTQSKILKDLIEVTQGQYRMDRLLASRESVWEEAFSSWQEQPYLGHGYGMTHDDYVLQSWFSSVGSVIDASGYFGVIASVGVVGIAMLFVLTVYSMRYVVRLTRLATLQPIVRTHIGGWWLSMFGGSLFVSLIVQAAGEPWLIAPGDFAHLMFWLSIGMMSSGASYLAAAIPHKQKRRRYKKPVVRNR